MKKVLIVDDVFVAFATSLYGSFKSKVRDFSAKAALPQMFRTQDSLLMYLKALENLGSSLYLKGENLAKVLVEGRNSQNPQEFFERLKKMRLYTRFCDEVDYNNVEEPFKSKYDGIEQAMHNKKILSCIKRVESTPSFDLTQAYKQAGGNQDLEIIVLAEPKVQLDSNIFHKNPETKRLAQESFNLTRALSLIDALNPDILLVDMQFPIWVPDKIKEIYMKNLQEKLRHPFELHALSSKIETNFPCYFSEEDFLLSFGDRTHNLGYGGTSLSYSGGAILGKMLVDKGRVFSFWTDEYAHGQYGIIHAHTLGALSDEDVKSVVESDTAYCQHWLQTRDTPPFMIQSTSGNLIIQSKSLFAYDFKSSRNAGFKKETLSRLDRVIELADTYQNK